MKMKYVAVQWDDAAGHDSEHGVGYKFPLAKIVTVGLLVRKTKKKVVIAQDFIDPNTPVFTVRSTISIPCVNIVKMLELTPK